MEKQESINMNGSSGGNRNEPGIDKNCESEVFIEKSLDAGCTVAGSMTHLGTIKRFQADDKFRHRLLHTACVWWTMVALGWRVGLVGPTFPDLQQIIDEDLSTASWIFTAISLGGLIGAVCGGAIYDRFNKTVLFVCLTSGLAIFALVTPWCSSFPLMFTAHVLHGAFTSAIDAVVTTDMVHVWKLEAGPYLQAVHFAFSIGAIISPFASKPFLAQVLEHTILKNQDFTNNSKTSTYSMHNMISSSNHSSDFMLGVATKSAELLATNQTDLNPETELRYGETNIHVTYMISMGLSLSATLSFIVLYVSLGNVYTKSIGGTMGSSDKLPKIRSYKLNKPWKNTFTILMAILLMLYCMNERNFIGFLMTFTISGLGWEKSKGAIATSALWIAFACGRFSGISVVKFLSISSVIAIYFGFMSCGTIGFWLSVIYGIEPLVWISIALFGFGMSVIFASVFSWLSEKIRRLTGKITSVLFVFLSVGAMLFPILAGYLMSEVSYIWFIYLQVILMIVTVVLFMFIEFLYRYVCPANTSDL